MLAAIAAANALGQAVYTPGRRYFFNGATLEIAGMAYGDGKNVTRWVFGGAPVKAQRTRILWRAEYDAGDYSANSDPAIGVAVLLATADATLQHLTITTDHNTATDYPLPFNSATDFPTSSYEVGVLVQKARNTLDAVSVEGVWSHAGLLVDGSAVGGIGDGFEASNCTFSGMWGVRIEGAQGAPLGGDDFADPAPGDMRTSGGISDVNFNGCKIFDTSGTVRLRIGGVPNKLVRRSAAGGALYISGQLATNTARRIQGVRFYNTRFGACDRFVYKVNFANRVEFVACHSEFRSGAFNTDGVTLITGPDCEVLVTPNARRVVYIGGEKSGEADNRTIKNTTAGVRIVSEFGFDNGSRRLSFDRLSDEGDWTPTFSGLVPGAPVYSAQYGRWVRSGNKVELWGRLILSDKGGMSGDVSIAGMPFAVANYAAAYDPSVALGVVSHITGGTSGVGGVANNGQKFITLVKLTSGAPVAALTGADLANTARVDFYVSYLTTEP